MFVYLDSEAGLYSIQSLSLSCPFGLGYDGIPRDFSWLALLLSLPAMGHQINPAGRPCPQFSAAHFAWFQDIVTESNKFDLVGFIPLLRERIYSNNQYARQFIISWVRPGPVFPAANKWPAGFSTAPWHTQAVTAAGEPPCDSSSGHDI